MNVKKGGGNEVVRASSAWEFIKVQESIIMLLNYYFRI